MQIEFDLKYFIFMCNFSVYFILFEISHNKFGKFCDKCGYQSNKSLKVFKHKPLQPMNFLAHLTESKKILFANVTRN